MTHPSGAGYKHTPAFIDRMKRAEGGEVQPAADGSDMEMRRSMRADGGGIGPESLSDADADTSPMAVEEKGRTIPMSQKEAMSGMNQPAQTMSGQGGSLNAALKGD